MRPGQQGPGNEEIEEREILLGLTFNEAGATRPRKLPGYGHGAGPLGAFNEAGATRPRKRAGRRSRAGLELGPSMRPGQQGPGNNMTTEKQGGQTDPSMRPGQQGPGNHAVDPFLEDVLLAFNEAGATRPRKPSATRSTRRWLAGPFNEAGATRPRKRQGERRRGHAGRRGPSMRPGQQGPGNVTREDTMAEAETPSMRPGQQGPGNGGGGLEPAEKYGGPSMRPGQQGPGNHTIEG